MKFGKSIFLAEVFAVGLLSLAGCSSREQAMQIDADIPQKEEVQQEAEIQQEADNNMSDPAEAAEESMVDLDNDTNFSLVGTEQEDTEQEAAGQSGNVFSEIPSHFLFSSGAGGWGTDIDISEDGSFIGVYRDSDMGDTGDGYPYGTVYICNFTGKFSIPEPTDKPYVYSMKLLELKNDDEDKIGTKEIIDETLYVYATPYGFEDADEFLIYMPGTPLSEMSEECLSWIFLSDAIFTKIPTDYYVIYNVGGMEAFTGQNEGSIWSRRFSHENGSASVNFAPSYYMGSYLNFFTEEGTPAAFSLSVHWDGESSEPIECQENYWGDPGATGIVTIKPDEGSTPEEMRYVITVECTSDPQFDFSPWGGSEPGKFSAVFTERKE